MDYITLAAVLFTVMFVVWGIFRGFWRSLAAIVSFLIAYTASMLFAMPLSKVLGGWLDLGSLNEPVAWGISATLLFVVVGVVVRLGILMVGKVFPVGNMIVNRTGGAILSGGYGAGIVVLLVWGASLLMDTWNGQVARSQQLDLAANGDAPKVVVWSRSVVGELVSWNARHSGASETAAEMAGAFAKDPAKALKRMKEALITPEFKEVVSSEKLQGYVRDNDVEALKNSPEFTAFVAHPSVKQLQAVLLPSGADMSDEEVAEHMAELWHDVDAVKNDPEVKVLLDDPEVQAFLQGGSQLTPSLLSKGQVILELINRKKQGK